MMNFRVAGMTCGGCARAVTNAVQRIDSDAKVEVDLKNKLVSVRTSAAVDRVEAVIGEAGYEVRQLAA